MTRLITRTKAISLLLALCATAAPAHAADPLNKEVKRVSKRLKAEGLQVERDKCRSPILMWLPAVDGTRLTVRDPAHELERNTAYSEKSSGEKVPATITLFLLPRGALSTTINMMSRQQPGDLLGALPGAYVFTLQSPQSGDQDDGQLLARVTQLLFEQEARGVRRADAIPEEGLPAEDGIFATLVSHRDGGSQTLNLTPQ